MPRFTTSARPSDTPWGSPNQAEQVLPGIWEVSTPSHGGFVLSSERHLAMPEQLRLEGCFYEEDVNWCLVVVAFEREFEHSSRPGAGFRVKLAHEFARNWHPDCYERFTGKPVELKDSHTRRRRAAYERHVGELVGVSASGSWADWVPEGEVGVVGCVLERVDHLGRPTHRGDPVQALVDKDRYDSSREVNAFTAIQAEIIETAEQAPATKQVLLP